MGPSGCDAELEVVPDTVLPAGSLPPLRYRDLPPPVSWRRMLGPSLILAGMALGSGEFILWPHITYKAGFVFFWGCILGVLTQFFLNMEIARWTLATGESAVIGFSRIGRHWAEVFLLLTLLPHAWPGWATGAGACVSWLLFGPEQVESGGTVEYVARHGAWFGVGSLLLVGFVLTAGSVVYRTVVRIQAFLVTTILVLLVVLAAFLVRGDALLAMLEGSLSFGALPPESAGLPFLGLLGALAFAGAGGAMNLGQSNFIKDKGYGMGAHIGRITSPITGEEEAIADTGYHFRHTERNLLHWRRWWRAANAEHFGSFLLTCLLTLALMSLVSYSLFYGEDGLLKPGLEPLGDGMSFIWGEAEQLEAFADGGWLKVVFLILGAAVLLTTELGILDGVSRIAADIVKVNWLRDHPKWTLSRLYYLFLWAEIGLGALILSIPDFDQPYFLLVTAAAMNGGVMLLYSVLLLVLNTRVLPRAVGAGPVRRLALLWSTLFFGYFSFQALRLSVIPYLLGAD